MLLFGRGTGYLSAPLGDSGQVLYFPHVLVFIPELFGSQEGLFSFT
jgi:hypothetical protein